MNPDIIAANKKLVEKHFHSEASREVEGAIALYTDDVVWEGPARKVAFKGKADVGAMYRRMWESCKDAELVRGTQVIDETHVVDDSTLTYTLVKDGIDNLNIPVGSKVRVRMIHFFEIRDGKISKETTHEMFERLS